MKVQSIGTVYNYTKLSKDGSEVDSSKKSDTKDDKTSAIKSFNELSQSEKALVMKLQQTDTHVRAHEAAHIAAGGSAVSGGASFTYQKGPDGKMYAVGGEVPITISKGDKPEETISNARQARAAALAPSDPSPQDLKVAATASMIEAQAMQELNMEKTEQAKNAYKTNYVDNKLDISV